MITERASRFRLGCSAVRVGTALKVKMDSGLRQNDDGGGEPCGHIVAVAERTQ